MANHWADQMLPLVRDCWSRHELGAWVDGATLCLSCLVRAERYAELEELLSLQRHPYWHFDMFQAEALARQGRTDEAIRYAEDHRRVVYQGDRYPIASFCERALLEAGRREEAYRRYGLIASVATTNLATFRKIARKYPERDPRQILLDLTERRADKGKWFAAAKDAGHLDIALQCAADFSAEPATLIRAARHFAQREPAFAAQVALYAIAHLLAGRGYEPTPSDIVRAYDYLMTAAAYCGLSEWAISQIEKLVAKGAATGCEAMLQMLQARLDR